HDIAVHLEQSGRTLAYPHGRYDARVRREAIRAEYEIAYATRPGRNGAGTDRWSLRRITPKAWDSRTSFAFKVLTGEPLPARWERWRLHVHRLRTERVDALLKRTPPGRRLRTAAIERAITRRVGGAAIALLDAGSEDGAVANSLARRHPDWQIVAVDYNAAAVRAGKAAAQSRRLGNVAFLRADVTQLPTRDRFDVVIAADSLTEIDDDDAALAAIGQALRPGGIVVIHTPVAGWRPVLRSSAHWWDRAVRDGYDADALTKKLECAGLDVIEISSSYHAVAHLAQEIRDRWIKPRRPAIQLLAAPALIGAVAVDPRVHLGRGRAMLVVARRTRA
ncbi:MAG TPA: methyltransferase domain-containing protein, partial [Acidimicrobiia bacterium]|nr:methyltransferase domain-containing protein [Acidimicrobiia bacterium]